MTLTSLTRAPALGALSAGGGGVAPQPVPAPVGLRPLRRDALALARVPVTGRTPAQATPIVSAPAGLRGSLEIAVRGGLRISQGNRTALYVDGDKAFPALVALIRGAKHTLYLETMIWHNDETGRMVAAELAAARKRGVDVRVLVDSIGQRFGAGRDHDPRLITWMRAQGIAAHTYNPHFVGPRGVSVTHHKLYIADNERFLSGGMNIGNEYARDWHDMLFQIEGPAAREAAREFAISWRKRTGEPLTIPPALAVSEGTNPSPGTAAVGFAVTDPEGRRFELRQVTLSMIRTARHSIRVQMPYNSDDEFLDALKAAARRGVNVEFIMPGANNDTLAFAYLNASEAKRLTAAGVKVRFYGEPGGPKAGRFSHLKMMMIDDVVAAVGSGNGDYRTFHDNNEVNAYVSDPQFLATLRREVWDKDWEVSAPVSAESVKRLPLWQRAAGNLLEVVDRVL